VVGLHCFNNILLLLL